METLFGSTLWAKSMTAAFPAFDLSCSDLCRVCPHLALAIPADKNSEENSF